MYIFKKIIVIVSNLVSNYRGQNCIVLKNKDTKLNKKFK